MSFEAQIRRVSELAADGRLSWDQYAAEIERIEAARAAAAAPPAAAARASRLQRPPPPPSPYYAQAPEQLWRDERMSASARNLVLMLLRLARGRASCDAFIDQLADLLGVTRRTVQYAQARAKACGYIEIERVREGRINDANIYHLLAPSRPTGRPEPRRKGTRRRSEGRRARRPRRAPVGVQKIASHQERSLTGTSPPFIPPPGEGNRSAARRSACGLAAAHVTAAPLAGVVRPIEARQGERVANSVPKTGPP